MRIILSVIFFSISFSQDFPIIGSDNSLDILTWNIETFPKHNETISYLTDIINDVNVDIIALQEITNQNDFDELISTLNGDWSGYRSANTNYGEISYLINNDHIEIVHYPYTILSDYEHYFAYREPYVVEIKYNNVDYILINNHFKCCGDGELNDGDYWDEEYRRLQASRYLKDYVDNNLSQDNVIILGDLNDVITDPPQDNVFLDFINSENYYFADTDIAYGPSSDWSYPSWPSHIDHIIISDELFSVLEDATIFTFKIDEYLNGGWNEYDNFISDHRPVSISFHFDTFGDINEDGGINILDIVVLVDLILNSNYQSYADLNEDGEINVLDVIILINIILYS